MLKQRIARIKTRVNKVTGGGILPPFFWTLGEDKQLDECSQHRVGKCPQLPNKLCDIEKCWLRRAYPKDEISLFVEDLWTMRKYVEEKKCEKNKVYEN